MLVKDATEEHNNCAQSLQYAWLAFWYYMMLYDPILPPIPYLRNEFNMMKSFTVICMLNMVFVLIFRWAWSTNITWKILAVGKNVFVFSCDQAAIWLVQSVRLSVRPSVCLSVRHIFFTMFPSSYHHEIFRRYYHGQEWCPCKRSRSEVKCQGHRGQHPT